VRSVSLLLVGFCVSCVPSGAPELPAPESANSLGASDTAAVLAVAAQFGIPNPARIGRPFSQYVGCPVVILESPVTVDGNRRSWVELWVRRKGRDTGGHRCEVYAPAGATVRLHDRWVASSEERTERTVWRVQDGDWHVDVALGTGVSFDSAALIVQAVRRQTLVNEIPDVLRRLMGDTLPVVDAGDIRTIEKSRESYVYKVKTGEVCGYVLSVSIDAGRVLVHNVGSWRS
jgi:hypothetical protein